MASPDRFTGRSTSIDLSRPAVGTGETCGVHCQPSNHRSRCGACGSAYHPGGGVVTAGAEAGGANGRVTTLGRVDPNGPPRGDNGRQWPFGERVARPTHGEQGLVSMASKGLFHRLAQVAVIATASSVVLVSGVGSAFAAAPTTTA